MLVLGSIVLQNRIIMKHSIMTFLCIFSLILVPQLQAFSCSSLLPQWRVGKLPTITGKTVDNAHSEYFRAWIKNFAPFVATGGILGGLMGYGLAKFNGDVSQTIGICIGFSMIGFGLGLLSGVIAPRAIALEKRMYQLNETKHALGNILLTQESIDNHARTLNAPGDRIETLTQQYLDRNAQCEERVQQYGIMDEGVTHLLNDCTHIAIERERLEIARLQSALASQVPKKLAYLTVMREILQEEQQTSSTDAQPNAQRT